MGERDRERDRERETERERERKWERGNRQREKKMGERVK